jgi:hypothetical protein
MAQHTKDGRSVVVHLAVSAYQHQQTTMHTKCGVKELVVLMADVAKVA